MQLGQTNATGTNQCKWDPYWVYGASIHIFINQWLLCGWCGHSHFSQTLDLLPNLSWYTLKPKLLSTVFSIMPKYKIEPMTTISAGDHASHYSTMLPNTNISELSLPEDSQPTNHCSIFTTCQTLTSRGQALTCSEAWNVHDWGWIKSPCSAQVARVSQSRKTLLAHQLILECSNGSFSFSR